MGVPADYIPVIDRVVRMRAEHPDWQLSTELLVDDGQRILMRAQITDAAGALVATAYAEETRAGKPRFGIETAETSAVGRVLRFSGYPDKAGLTPEELGRALQVGESPPRQGRALSGLEAMAAAMAAAALDPEQARQVAESVVGRPIAHAGDLAPAEVAAVTDAFRQTVDGA